ncbi:hypothetical protein, partial [Aeromonas caviae]|uniref:hypothetical protein n=1 Tax=Aeromonas caviae TaxID=648 RepID=UPI003F749397
MLATQDPFEEAEKLQQQRGNWIMAGVETRVFWPQRAQTISFEGIQFLLQPAERSQHGDALPAIALRTKEGANKRGNSSRLTQSFHFFMFEPIF